MDWTEEQQQAVVRPGRLLVAAAAGSGKTAVLVERVLHFLLRADDPAELDEMLVVTYTRSAAAEMQERIRQALDKTLAEETGPDTIARVMEQLALLPQAKISTLHSFCMSILRRCAYMIGLKPDFRLADERECAAVREEVLAEVAEQYYAGRGAEMEQLVRYATTGFDDKPFLAQIKELYRFALNEPDPEGWLRRLPDPYETSPAVILTLPWGAAALRHVRRQLENARDCLRLACHMSSRPFAPAEYLSALTGEFRALERQIALLGAPHWTEFTERLREQPFGRLPQGRVPPMLDEEQRGIFRALKKDIFVQRERAKMIWKDLRRELTSWPLEEQAGAWAGCADLARGLAEWTSRFMAAYRKRKLELNIAEYSDLEHWAVELLSLPDFPSDMFRQILVDEYQDVNGVQERILELVAGQADFFLVGDVKQSIYRFRGGDPGLFLQKYRSYEQVIRLKKNFRSRPEIVAGVNALFSRIMSEDAGEINYDEGEALVYGAPYPPPAEGETLVAGPVECCCFDADALQEMTPWHDLVKDTEVEAYYTASRIMTMVRPLNGEPAPVVFDRDLNGYRPLSFADIAVLMRSGAGQMSVYKEVFARFGVPCFGEAAADPHRPAEVEMITDLLRILDNPRQDIPLAAVLHSPVGGLSGDDLARIRCACPEGEFWAAVREAVLLWRENGAEPALSEKLSIFLDKYTRWRSWLRHYPLDEIIWRLYGETGLMEIAGAMTGGNFRRENLEEFYRQARQF
ncbi:MAG: UvrD-helicase domain-containing protein, partial [Gracilibacteraceae bacterium]|nr:UvrD-helicase domain-containing protein [Gracilibacteraceae bacterium]